MASAPIILPQDDYDRILMENVRPPDWVNPEPVACYNMVVIGAGAAGLVTAAGAASLGAKVALIERHLLGGDCLNYGCVPSKGIIRAAKAIHYVRTSPEFGIATGEGVSIDFATAMKRMRLIRADISAHDSARRFRDELGVDVFFGVASFVGTDAVEVEGKRLNFAKAAICTGARGAELPIPGLAEAGYLTNETIFSLTGLPPRLAVIGGGPIGCELAQAFARLGSKVNILEMQPQILGREDHDAVRIVYDAIQKEGISVHLLARIIKVERRGAEKVIIFEKGGETLEVAVDEILVGVGRTPNTEGLNLEAAGVAYDLKQGVKVNDRLQTSNPRVYAAGDICSPYKFTHTADAMARILIANALFMGRRKSSALTIPWCTYTDPEVAHVGMYEGDAREKGIEVTTLTAPLTSVDRALLDGETEGFARVHLKKGTDRILGATIVARHAGEMINELSLAITSGLGLSSVGKTIHPYPTQAEAIRKLADEYNRTRLTPFIKKLLYAWLTWRRS
jgi:pyruvate/2-oxoglutarate dehydrogenase complex dihydrolipoamide dehydrogenase (E3) component